MEIGQLSSNLSSSFASLRAVEGRAPANRPRTEELAQARQSLRDAQEAAGRQQTQENRDARETTAPTTSQTVQPTGTGEIQFEDEQGTRVMKVLDSKDVLIYQVPPKGVLTLIRAAEADERRALALA